MLLPVSGARWAPLLEALSLIFKDADTSFGAGRRLQCGSDALCGKTANSAKEQPKTARSQTSQNKEDGTAQRRNYAQVQMLGSMLLGRLPKASVSILKM